MWFKQILENDITRIIEHPLFREVNEDIKTNNNNNDNNLHNNVNDKKI